jgi:hypothetical protein
MALGKALTGIEPCPMMKNSSLSTIGSNPFGILKESDFHFQSKKNIIISKLH